MRVSCFTVSLVAVLVCFASAVQAESHSATSVSAVPAERILAISSQIDALVVSNLKKHGEQPQPKISDEVFLRRIYLDVIGRIPTLAETREFLDAKQRDRGQLIDELLDSSGHVSHQFNYWADVLRIKSRLSGGNPGQPYIDFVKHALRSHKPYDQFVRELIASEGPALERDNGATGYYLRDNGMPEDNMANTVRIFLGTRMECAQCHDHPFDSWTQRQFFEMVAFAGGMRTRTSPSQMSGGNMRRQLQKADAEAQVKQVALNLIRPLSYGVVGGGTGLARLPDSYQYDDGEPNEIVKAKTMFGELKLVHPQIPKARKGRKPRVNKRNPSLIPGAKDIASRDAFATWLTSPDNPRFTTVIANRLWKRAMGLGLIEPIDDIAEDTVASNRELMEYLSRQMIELGYDTRQFLRAIYNSKTYQRQAYGQDLGDPAEYLFSGPVLRRMTGEQLWDSFLTLAVPELDDRENRRNKIRPGMYGGVADLYEGYEKAKDLSVEQVLAMAEESVALRKDPEKRRAMFREAMAANAEPKPFAAESQKLKRQIAVFKQAQKKARKNKKRQAVRLLQVKIDNASQLLKTLPMQVAADFVRASELDSPAKAGHFIREFGQSDREQIENANLEPAVNQVLSLMNGQIEKRIIGNSRTVLMRDMTLAKTTGAKIDVAFLTMLSRYPNRHEKKMWLEIARAEGRDAAHDLIWALANTNEFMFVQ